jgi:hypothetical protein
MASPKTIEKGKADETRRQEAGYVPMGRHKGHMRYAKLARCPLCTRGKRGSGPVVLQGRRWHHKSCINIGKILTGED